VKRRLFLPVLSRHLLREFGGTFLLTLLAFVAIYILTEFFDRLDSFLGHGATPEQMARYFLLRIPFVLSQVTPFAVLVGSLVSLGLLARQNEFVALRACGVSVWQLAVPLFVAAIVITLTTLAWNETVVPTTARRARTIESVEIRKRAAATVFTGRDVWFHGAAGFYNIDKVSLRLQTLYGVTIYQVGSDFQPARIIEIDEARWMGSRWRFAGHQRTRIFAPEGARERPGLPRGFTLPETLADFGAVEIEPEALGYGMLRRQIKDLKRKGVNTDDSLVDLHLKLALPAASIIMMLIAVPLATAGTRLTSFAASVGLGFVVGFAYFVVVAFAHAIGKDSSLPPMLAAWSANGLFACIGTYFLLGADEG